MDLLIKNGKIITETKIIKSDLGIKDGLIKKIAPEINGQSQSTIDADGMLVMPGVIDAHVHMQLPAGGTISSDDFESGTRAAACGGVTTIVDFAIQRKGSSLKEAITERRREADNHVAIDYALHAVPTDWNDETSTEIPEIIEMGIPIFKMYMVYGKQGLQSDDKALMAALSQTSRYGGMVTVHAESPNELDRYIEKYHTREMMAEHGAYCHALSRPNDVEALAIERVVKMAEDSGGKLYIVHLSTAEGADIIHEARKRGVTVFAETCPQYLLLDDSLFHGDKGYLYASAPPLRKQKDIDRLWRGLVDNDISVIATDHCPFTTRQKSVWDSDFTKIPCGLPGVETLLPLCYTYGVSSGKFTLKQLVRLLCSNPARLMGLYPQKGTIQVGSDADLVIFNPHKKVKISHGQLKTNCDWSPYENWEIEGYPEITLSRGEMVYDRGKFIGNYNHGRFIPRNKIDDSL